MIRTLTAEHDTVEDVSRDADAEDEGIQIAAEEAHQGPVSLKGDDVIGVVPRNKGVYVTIVFAVTKVHWNLHYRRHGIRNLADVLLHKGCFMFYSVPKSSSEQTYLFSVMHLLTAMIKSAGSRPISLLSEIIPC